MMQHVNHRSHIRWAETLRSEYFVDVLGEVVNGPRGLILVNIGFNYERQIDLGEHVAIATRVARIGTRSFEFVYDVISDDHNHRCANGRTTMVAYDYIAHRSIPLPAEWRVRILAYEKVAPLDAQTPVA